jgi:hypothetical protein
VSDPYSRSTFGSVKGPRESSHIACRPDGYGVPVLVPRLLADRSEEDRGAFEVRYGLMKGHTLTVCCNRAHFADRWPSRPDTLSGVHDVEVLLRIEHCGPLVRRRAGLIQVTVAMMRGIPGEVGTTHRGLQTVTGYLPDALAAPLHKVAGTLLTAIDIVRRGRTTHPLGSTAGRRIRFP